MAKTKQYKWTLRKGSKKEICPKCGKKRFVPFVLTVDERVLAGEAFGRCDREQSCGYFRYPEREEDEQEFIFIPKVKKPTSYIDAQLMEATLKYFELQTLFSYFRTIFSSGAVKSVWERYKVGTAKNGASIFWQVDNMGRVRTGKIMQYLQNGKRNKADFGTWVHKVSGEKDFELKQCFFGLHLTKGNDKPIGIVESEKTALYMALVRPDTLWLASGGAHNIQSYKFRGLGSDITLYPDKGCAKMWQEKTNGKYNIDFTLEDSDLPDGVDLMDYLQLKEQ